MLMLYLLIGLLCVLGGWLIGLATGASHGFKRALDRMHAFAQRCGPLESDVIHRAANLIEEEEKG